MNFRRRINTRMKYRVLKKSYLDTLIIDNTGGRRTLPARAARDGRDARVARPGRCGGVTRRRISVFSPTITLSCFTNGHRIRPASSGACFRGRIQAPRYAPLLGSRHPQYKQRRENHDCSKSAKCPLAIAFACRRCTAGASSVPRRAVADRGGEDPCPDSSGLCAENCHAGPPGARRVSRE